jgi:cytochrome oxidase Cu insertion factor (SCO1/SenC/PrrC family)
MRRKVWMGLLLVTLACFLSSSVLAQEGERGERRRSRRPPRPKVGQVVPDFTLNDVKGKPVKLSSFKGKKIFVLELGACT